MKFLKTLKGKFVAGTSIGAASLAAPMAFAVDRTAEITAAGDVAKANYVAVIGAVFAIAIVGFGFAALMGWLKR